MSLKLTSIALFLSLLGGAASAAPIFPPMISGEASVRIITPALDPDAGGVPLHAPIQSVSLLSEGVSVHCETMGNSESKWVQFTIPNNPIGRIDVIALTYPIADCTGLAGEPSTNTAHYFFVGPLPADLAL